MMPGPWFRLVGADELRTRTDTWLRGWAEEHHGIDRDRASFIARVEQSAGKDVSALVNGRLDSKTAPTTALTGRPARRLFGVGRAAPVGEPGLIMSGDAAEGPLIGTHRASPQPPGRGLLIRRKQRPVLVQTVSGYPASEPAG